MDVLSASIGIYLVGLLILIGAVVWLRKGEKP